MKLFFISISFCYFLFACSNKPSENTANSSPDTSPSPTTALSPIDIDPNKKNWTVPIRQLTDKDYPDNPDIMIRHSNYDRPVYTSLEINRLKNNNFDLKLIPEPGKTDTIIFANIDLLEWMPTAPEQIKKDEYLTYVGLINQEWNRQQVRFNSEDFIQKGSQEKAKISRYDLARNCLNAYLWEVIGYAEEDDKSKPYYHGWFDFPKDLYALLFEERNDLKYEKYRPALEEWVDPPLQTINLDVLRTVKTEKNLEFEVHNNNFYPLLGERKKKHPNIVHPSTDKISKITDFLNDDTQFATFSPPGFYDTKDPRKTELSRFSQLKSIQLRTVTVHTPEPISAQELEYTFSRSTDGSLMRLVIGGLYLDSLPSQNIETLHKGWQMPMGIANHSFYETYAFQQKHKTNANPYYAFLLDEKGQWLDSHSVGIDGPLFYWDTENPQNLHLWILSFERHAFVGHISTFIKENT